MGWVSLYPRLKTGVYACISITVVRNDVSVKEDFLGDDFRLVAFGRVEIKGPRGTVAVKTKYRLIFGSLSIQIEDLR